MSKFSLKLQKTQIFGMLAMLGISLAVVKLSLAITAFTPANQPIGYVAQDEVTNYNLTGGQETLFRTEYKRDYWGGNLYAYPVDATGNVQTGTDRWNGGAAVHISAQNWDTGRFIATMSDAAAPGTGVGVAFRDTSLSAAQNTSLSATINTTAYTSAQIVNFLRGDLTNASATALRVRSSLLGDIVHSRPYYIADATNPTVFVGANDGMLHAINTADGTERWAYVPSMLISKLKTLAYNPTDATLPYAHDYFVDGQTNIATLSNGTRVLIGGLGAGGKGLYALNITGSAGLTAASETAVAAKIMWEVTPTTVNYATPQVHTSAAATSASATAYNHLGYTYGTPLIAKINYGGTPMDVIIIGNGYDPAATGESYLYVINATTGALVQAIQAGTAGAANPNGLSSPAALDTNGDTYVDRVYAGDLNGTMWKFDLSSANPSLWSASALLVTSPAQPITTTPGVALHPNGGYMVSFGTGKVFTGAFGTYNHTTSTWTTASTGDLADTSVYYAYGVWDGAPASNTAALTQTLTERSYTFAGATTRVRRSTANTPNWAAGGTKYWKVALPAGERVIGEGSFTENGRFYFIGYNPTVAPYQVPGTTTDVFGENWLMELNYLTGGSSTTPFLDMDSNLLLNDADRIAYIASDTKPTGKNTGDPILTPNEDGIPVGKWLSTGVQSQPILVQLQTLNTTLFNQNPDVIFPPTTAVSRGVAGGHFDVDNFYGVNNKCSNVGGTTGNLVSVSNTSCTYVKHEHEYDKKYDKTGVNMLNASQPAYNLSNAIPSTATNFKVLMMNQYLNPAVSLHIGNASYSPSSAAGYISVKNYQTSATLDITTVPTYNRNTIGSLAINMPVDAFSIKDWWGSGDARAGLHSVSPGCAWSGSGIGADMYQPVIPPANGTDGPGTAATTTGARHNGTLTVQIIKDTTPASAIEQNVAGRPEYGYRVNQANFYQYVLVEYIFYWHHPRNMCYSTSGTAWSQSKAWNTTALMTGSGWTKAPPPDIAVSTANSPPASGSTDPKLGVLGSTGTVSSTATSVAGNVTTTTITYTDGTSQKIVQTANADGTVTIVSTMYAVGGAVTSTSTNVVANAAGSVKTGGDERGSQARTGRVSWHELIRQ